MISIRDIRALASEWRIAMTTVEKEYVTNWILHAIASDPATHDAWIFTGGMSIRKCYSETWRLSDTLTFAVASAFPADDVALEKRIKKITQAVAEKSGIEFSLATSSWEVASDGSVAQGRITFRSVTANRPLVSIPFRLQNRSQFSSEPVLRFVEHAFNSSVPSSPSIPTHPLENLFIERLLDLRSHDAGALYDTVHLFWRNDFVPDARTLRAILTTLADEHGLGLLTEIETTTLVRHLPQMEQSWEQQLKEELWKVPPFAHYRDAIPLVFSWLKGDLLKPERPSLMLDDVDLAWHPPPTVAFWGFGIPVEAIRFAATNHLCVQMQYGGIKRLIEPYALRLTLDGNMTLCARLADSGNPRSYRIDRMESVWITDIPFEPVYKIEMGSIHSPTMQRASDTAKKVDDIVA